MVIKQITSLEKIRQFDALEMDEISKITALKGERISYQIAVHSEKFGFENIGVSIKSTLSDYIKVYRVEQAVMDYPMYPSKEMEEGYITYEPGLMPDILTPLSDFNNILMAEEGKTSAIWIEINIPENIDAGKHCVEVNFDRLVILPKNEFEHIETKKMELTILNEKLPAQKLLYTQWFHADCLCNYYDVEPYSEKHWHLIDKYMETASYTGINMLLVPIFTPPVDTRYKHHRLNIQLIDVTYKNGKYSFNFDKVRRWIQLCRKNNINYFEISHLFTQWGGAFSPNILAETENGTEHIFGWHVGANDEKYINFLNECIPQLIKVLKEENADKNTYFHISDESGDVEQYRRNCDVVRPLVKGFKTMDATTSVQKYKEGMVDCPVSGTNRILDFIEAGVEEPWTYYCCGHYELVGNRFLSMTSARNRIVGLQMYRHGVKGFLHWGFNYYDSFCSAYRIDPYRTTSGDSSYPSGDPFSVYPAKDGANPSLRAAVFYDALQDVRRAELCEKYIGREKVCAMIDDQAGYTLTFKEYPKCDSYILKLRDKMNEIIAKNL